MWLVRPMLGLARAASEALCRAGGVVWHEDGTNQDRSRWRARLRAEVLPVLRAMRPDVHVRAGEAGELLWEAAGALEREASALVARARRDAQGGLAWTRGDVGAVGMGVLGEAMRRVRAELVGVRHADRLRTRDVRAIHQAIADPDAREREWTMAGVRIGLDSEWLRVRASEPRP